MIKFPNVKINLGLNITSRRTDGYHNLMTVMVPVPWCDVLEAVPAAGHDTTLTVTGHHVDCPMEKNLVIKALRAVEAEVGDLPPLDIFLHKNVPDGAGLGGGSADAAFMARMVNEMFDAGLDDDRLCTIMSRIGADCPFFVGNRPAWCTGTGTVVEPIDVPALDGLYIVIAKPRVAAVSTAEAYRCIVPREPECTPLEVVTSRPVGEWRGLLVNDFEQPIMQRLPRVAEVKQAMYDAGALYAAMSGSGAAVFGLFDTDKLAQEARMLFVDCDTFLSRLGPD